MIQAKTPLVRNVADHEAGPDHTDGEKKRLSVSSTTFFIVTGVMNVIPLPFALKQVGLISGVLIMAALSFAMIYMSVVIGRCWLILLERWPERYANKQVRRPFPAIAEEARGKRWAFLVGFSVNVTNIGTAVVDLLVTANTIQILLPHHLSDRVWVLICTAASLPFVWLGRPMESWTVGWAGGLTGIFGTLLLLAGIVVAGTSANDGHHSSTVTMATPATTAVNSSLLMGQSAPGLLAARQGSTPDPAVTFKSFWLGMSTLSFTFAGMSIFPSLQHDMRQPRQWPQAIIVAYIIIAALCISTALTGFEYFHGDTLANIIGNVSCVKDLHAAKVLADIISVIFIIQFLCNAIVSILPVVQDFEQLLNDRVFPGDFQTESKYCVRVCVRGRVHGFIHICVCGQS